MSAVNKTELTPGRSGPVTVIRTLVSVIPDSVDPCVSARPRVVVRQGAFRRGLRGHLVVAAAATGVRLLAGALHEVRVVQLERRTLRTDPGQLGEVVPRRRAARGPLQRVPEAPRVVHGHDAAVTVAAEDVPD